MSARPPLSTDLAYAEPIAKALRNERKQILKYYLEDYYEYTGTHYKKVATKRVRREILKFCNKIYNDQVQFVREFNKACGDKERKLKYPEPVTVTLTNQVERNLETEAAVEKDHFPVWDGLDDRSCLAFQNGLVDRKVLERQGVGNLERHDARWFSPNVLPFNYDAKAECPLWHEFIDKVVPDKENQELLQEWFGLCMTPDNGYHNFMVLEGAAGAGKGTITRVLQGLVGEQNYSAVPLHNFGNRFALASLFGKTLNVCPEASSVTKLGTEMLKALSGEDPIETDKKHKDPIMFKSGAKVIILTNSRPKFADKSDGVRRRMLVIKFTEAIGRENEKRGLSETLLREEASGIFNWAMQGYVRLKARGYFPEPAVMREHLDRVRAEDDPDGHILSQIFVRADGEEMPITTAYSHYEAACADYEHDEVLKRKDFYVAMDGRFPWLKQHKATKGPFRNRDVFVGLKLAPKQVVCAENI